MDKDYDHLIKIILIGESGVGKSSLLSKYCDDTFHEYYTSTIGVDFKINTVTYNGKIVKLQLWDTAGQERFRTITTTYYRNTNSIILVFDLSNKASFLKLTSWIVEINKHISTRYAIILVGNKLDSKSIEITKDDITDFLTRFPMPYIECSAKTGENVENIFKLIVEKTFENKILLGSNKEKINVPQVRSNSMCCLIR